MRVVPTLDEVEHRHAGLDLGFETLAVEQLAFEGGEEALAHGVIEAITHRAIEGRTPACSQRLPKANEVYWLPWSEWWITPVARRWASALSSALSTSSVRR